MTITINLDTDDVQREIDTARDAFPGATSICVETDDGNSATIYPVK